MREEVQERVEDYLGLERYIEQLRLQRSARLPNNLAPQQTRIYGMAHLFHVATPRVADPHPEFSAQLGQHLRKQLQAAGQSSEPVPANLATPSQGKKQFRTIFRTILRQNQLSQPTHTSPTHLASTDEKKDTRRDIRKKLVPFSRRKLAAVAAEIVVTLGIGAGAGAAIEQALAPQPVPTDPHPSLVDDNWQWQPVAFVAQLGKEAHPFTTETVTGYLLRQPENSTEPIIALSAACTHLGCTVQWQKNKREFVCPCHGSIFGATGAPSPENRQPYAPLPHLDTKTEDGIIYVKVPSPTQEGYH